MKLIAILLTFFTTFAYAGPLVDSQGIAEHPEKVSPLLPGTKVKNTCLQDLDKQKVCTEDLFKQKPSIIVVYRGGWCPYCNGQLNKLKTIENKLTQLGYQILAVSPDSNKNITKQKSREQLSYQLLTDNELALTKTLGLAYFLDKKTEKRYRDRVGVPFVDIHGDNRVSLPVPAVFIIAPDGLVHFQYVNPNFKTRLDEEVLLLAAKKALEAM